MTDMSALDVGTAAEFLGKIKFFDGLPPAYLRRISELVREETYQPGEIIFAEGDRGDKFYIVLSGAVRVSRMVPGVGEEALSVLREGDHFGEMSLIDDSPRSAHVLAHEACRLLVLSREDLEDLLFIDRDLAYDLLWNLVRTLTLRLRETNNRATFLALASKF